MFLIVFTPKPNLGWYEDETLGQGVLAYHLLQAIKEAGDTTLLVRQWFDEAIKGVIEYSRANGNKQEPNSFGDGRFEIGNVTEQVRSIIDISCPKTRIGLCVITDPTGDAEAMYPTLKEKVNAHFTKNSSRGSLIYSKNSDRAYRIEGSYSLNKKKIQIRFKIYFGDKQMEEAIVLPPIKNKSEDELVKIVVQSIQSEIERIDKRDEKCKRKNK